MTIWNGDGVADTEQLADDVPELDLTDPDLVRDPFAAYGRARERAPLARTRIPGIGPVWVVTRHAQARAMLSDPRFAIRADSFTPPPGVPDGYLPYLRTMSEQDATEHARLRRLVAPAFSMRRAAEFRRRIEPLVAGLLDGLAGHTADGVVDLLPHFARPLPMDVICELADIPAGDRPAWHRHGAAVLGGGGADFAAAVPGIVDSAKAAVAQRRADPGDDLVSALVRVHDEDGDRLGDVELVTLLWHLVLAGQTPANLIANAVVALLQHPDQLAELRRDPALVPNAVEELIRWCGPTLLTIPRYAREDLEFCGRQLSAGDAVTASVAAANRDPRAFGDPDQFDLRRDTGRAAHLGFAHGPHFCLGAALARVQTGVALTALLTRFPGLALADGEDRAMDPGTWRVASLRVTLGSR